MEPGREVRIPKTESGTAMSKWAVWVFFIPNTHPDQGDQDHCTGLSMVTGNGGHILKPAHQNVSAWKARVQKLPRNSDPMGASEARWREQVGLQVQSQHCLLLHLTVRTCGQEEAFWRAEMEKEKVFLKRNVLTESCGSHLSPQHPRRQR